MTLISIHAPAWGATNEHHAVCGERVISIHAPAWGATSCPSRSQCGRQFQSTHPHGVRRHVWADRNRGTPYFNPRTRMGCDPSGGHPACGSANFNPRTRMGCDLPVVSYERGALVISIHAPAWGATSLHGLILPPWSNFNPRTRMGCDVPGICGCQERHNFNPRTRMGCDLLWYGTEAEALDFNPRTRMGCDLSVVFCFAQLI